MTSVEVQNRPLADALVVCFTHDTSLESLESLGLLQREWALYRGVQTSGHGVGRIIAVTHGRRADAALGAALGAGVTVVCNEDGLSRSAYLATLADRVIQAVGDAASVIVKTTQMEAGDEATTIAAGLRSRGKTVALIARAGFLWSRFTALEQGTGTAAAIAAGEAEGRLCKAADLLMGTTKEMVDDLSWRFGVPESRTAVVPNYVLAGDVPAEEPRARGVILFAGRLVPQKRVDRLIEAVGGLRDDLKSSVTLSILGSGPLEASLRQQAEALGVRATFEPRQRHDVLIERMRRCAVFAQTSSFEAHPKTVIEAMSVGCPVVVCDTPGMRGIVRHAVTGMCVPPEMETIRLSLEGLLDDADWGQTLGAAGAASVRSAYAIERVLEQELAAYRRAMEIATRDRGTRTVNVASGVRFEAELLSATNAERVEAFARAIAGFARRLGTQDRARFLLGLDAPLYQMQGEAAVDAEGGLHPKHRIMRYHDFFVERVKPGERVIDLGCGVGALAASIAQRSEASVTGMDWSEKNLARARETAARSGLSSRLEYVLGDITKDAAKPGGGAAGFDVLVLSNVLEHIADRPERLRTWAKWYQPQRFLIRVPRIDRDWRVPFKKELGLEWRLDDTHETEYTREQLRAELAQAGLKVTEWVEAWEEFWVSAEAA